MFHLKLNEVECNLYVNHVSGSSYIRFDPVSY